MHIVAVAIVSSLLGTILLLAFLIIVYKATIVVQWRRHNKISIEDNGVPTRRLMIERGQVISIPQTPRSGSGQHSFWPRSIYSNATKIPSSRETSSILSSSHINSMSRKPASRIFDVEAQKIGPGTVQKKSFDYSEKPNPKLSRTISQSTQTTEPIPRIPTLDNYSQAISESVQRAYLGPSELREGIALSVPIDLKFKPSTLRAQKTGDLEAPYSAAPPVKSALTYARRQKSGRASMKSKQPGEQLREKQLAGQSYYYSVTNSETTRSSVMSDVSQATSSTYTIANAKQMTILEASISRPWQTPITSPYDLGNTIHQSEKALPPSPNPSSEPRQRDSILSALSSPTPLSVNRMSR
ncbi:hypothetical protein MMC06_002349 [Schaereria dolodes]|nr:hypothetical protein [Schaereria dolodes]